MVAASLLLDSSVVADSKVFQSKNVPPASTFWSRTKDASNFVADEKMFVSQEKSIYFKGDLPNNYWSLDEDGSGFMPAVDPEALTYMQNYHDRNMKEQNQRDMSSSSSSGSSGSSSSKSPYSNYFVDGSETFWSEGAQAWHLLGFYIDCYEVEKGYDDRRHLNDNQDNNNQNVEYGACVRYLLWAAYIDVYYEGGGIGEYMFWDNDYNAWDTTACDEMAQYDGDSNRRCAKMDCHLQGSNHFKLLGFFKEPNFAQFYEQLFKHSAICLWDEDTYDFMQTMREVWPSGCTNSGVTDGKNTLYFDVKPKDNADLTIGLYTDARCSVDYQGQEETADVLAAYSGYGNNNGNSMTVGDLYYYMDYWNSAMASFKQCQPCKSYDLSAEYEEPEYCEEVEKTDDYYKSMYGHYWYYYKKYGEPGDDYYLNKYVSLYGKCEGEDKEDDYSNDDSQGHFTCEDDAGYKNVNQCMKFATHTRMMAATFRDVLIGANQGTIMPVYVGHISVRPGAYTTLGSQWRTTDFLAVGFSSLFFIGSAVVLCQSWRRAQESAATQQYRLPLVPATSGGFD
ncbi:hypothetical protein ACA910_005335 [Epithemia clementina (nom. ined.)]